MRRKQALFVASLLLLSLLVFLAMRSCAGARRRSQEPLLHPRMPSAAAELAVAFWNIRDFSSASRTQDELRAIARVVHPFDCVAISELNDEQVLRRLAGELAALGGQWEGIQTATKAGNSPGSAEYYGFVYRADKLRIRSPPRILPEKSVPLPGDAALHRFDRDPATCSFVTHDGRLDFTLIVVHVTWGTKVSLRKAEVRALKQYFLEVQEEDPSDQDVLLGGDFNRNAGDDSLAELLSIPSMTDVTDPHTPTVIAGTSTYDHILFQREFVTEFTGARGVDKFDETLFGRDVERARRVCSDHRPVWIRLRIPERDDD